MAAAKTHDFEIRAAIVREWMHHGVPRRDIRHQITLDSHSSGDRADVVAICDDRLIGIEIRSGADNLARCVQQLDAYVRAFDVPLFVVDDRLTRRLERPDRQRVRTTAVAVADISQALVDRPGQAATVDGMARLLWGSEIQALVGQAINRDDGLDWIRQNLARDDLRCGVIEALRTCVPNKCEDAFWAQFDAGVALEHAA